MGGRCFAVALADVPKPDIVDQQIRSGRALQALLVGGVGEAHVQDRRTGPRSGRTAPRSAGGRRGAPGPGWCGSPPCVAVRPFGGSHRFRSRHRRRKKVSASPRPLEQRAALDTLVGIDGSSQRRLVRPLSAVLPFRRSRRPGIRSPLEIAGVAAPSTSAAADGPSYQRRRGDQRPASQSPSVRQATEPTAGAPTGRQPPLRKPQYTSSRLQKAPGTWLPSSAAAWDQRPLACRQDTWAPSAGS